MSFLDSAKSTLIARVRVYTQELGVISWNLITKDTPADAFLGHLSLLNKESRTLIAATLASPVLCLFLGPYNLCSTDTGLIGSPSSIFSLTSATMCQEAKISL